MEDTKKIIHVDMDAFYASIEQINNPKLIGKPIIVGADPNRGGVVATCSYEARKFGIHSAMSSMEAYKLCPHAIFVKSRMNLYKQVSNEIMNILYSYSDLVEPLALDEAFIDVTVNKSNIKSATVIAKEIKQKIYLKTKLNASAGVSYNKFLAKVASDFNKPNGLTVITPKTSNIFLESLSIDKFWGVGKVTKNKLNNIGIFTGSDLKRIDKKELVHLFNDKGKILYNFARGIDDREINPNRIRKSIGKEITLVEGLIEFEEILVILLKLSEEVERRLLNNKTKGYTITLKIKFFDFQNISKRATFEN
ncbi:DNA polymerase IV, partial [Clostridium tarantellae]